MSTPRAPSPRGIKPQTMALVRQAFVDHGYEALTMSLVAEACGLSRRALYNHFRNKEEVFRAMLRWRNREDFAAGAAAAGEALERGDGPVEVITAFLDARFGDLPLDRRDIDDARSTTRPSPSAPRW